MSEALLAAIFRFVGILVAGAVAIAIVIYVPDPTIKTIGAGLAAASVLALEEWLKTRRDRRLLIPREIGPEANAALRREWEEANRGPAR